MKKNPKLSVIIPVYNEEADIRECLESLQKQSYNNFEIIIIDDGSTDRTLEIVKKFPKTRILKQNHQGPGKARNLGAKNANGEILIIVDADMVFDKDYLKYMIEPMIRDIKIIGTEEELQLANNTHNIWSKCWGKIRSIPEQKERKTFRAMKKSEFLKLGGFDSKYGYRDDQTFLIKYGLRPVIARKAICYHNNPETLGGVFKQSRWIGASMENRLFKIPVIRYLSLMFLYLFSPLAIILLAIKNSYNLKNFKIFFYMIIFMIYRYFGTLNGILKRIRTGENFK